MHSCFLIAVETCFALYTRSCFLIAVEILFALNICMYANRSWVRSIYTNYDLVKAADIQLAPLRFVHN
jgi:hypothetical protein